MDSIVWSVADSVSKQFRKVTPELIKIKSVERSNFTS